MKFGLVIAIASDPVARSVKQDQPATFSTVYGISVSLVSFLPLSLLSLLLGSNVYAVKSLGMLTWLLSRRPSRFGH